jgi:hypothetical protein
MKRLSRPAMRGIAAVVLPLAATGVAVVVTSTHDPTHQLAIAQTAPPPAPVATRGATVAPRPVRPSEPIRPVFIKPRPQQASAATTHPNYAHMRWNFDSGTSGWTGGAAGRISSTHAPVLAGRGALSVLTGTAHDTESVASSPFVPAREGVRVFGSFSVRADARAGDVDAAVVFFDSRRHQLDAAFGQLLSPSTRGWSRAYDAIGVAPSGTAYAVLQFAVNASTSSGATYYLDNASLDQYSSSSADVIGPLRTVGNRVVDARGHTVVLRGFTRSGLEGTAADPPTAEDIAHAKGWGANVIRLPLGEQFLLTSSCNYESGYLAEIDNAVDLVTRLGMVALLDLHTNSLTNCGSYGQQPMADYPGSISFWKELAGRYQHNPLVAFDLYNEPHDISDDVWRSGGSVTWHGTRFTAAGMQQMYDAVRSTGARNLVIVTGNGWGNRWPATAPLPGYNIVYGAHAYTCQVSPPPDCANPAPYDPSQFFQWWVEPGASVPVAVTEFGWPDPSDGRYLTAVINFARAQGWGWTVYTWGDANWGPFSLLATAGRGRAYEPQPTGEAVLAGFPLG